MIILFTEFADTVSADFMLRAIRTLVETGVLLVGRWDRNPLNRTNWYSLDEARLAALVAAQRAGTALGMNQTPEQTLDTRWSRDARDERGAANP